MASRKRRANARLDVTAFHEAGHAVIGIVRERRFAHVQVIPCDDLLGQVATLHRPLPMESMWDFSIAELTLAGPIAERVYTGRWDMVGCATDCIEVASASRSEDRGKLAAYIAQPRVRRRLDAKTLHAVRRMLARWRDPVAWWRDRRDQLVAATHAAAELVAAWWPSIERVAAALVARRRLSYGAVKRLVRPGEAERAALSGRALEPLYRKLVSLETLVSSIADRYAGASEASVIVLTDAERVDLLAHVTMQPKARWRRAAHDLLRVDAMNRARRGE